MSDFARVMEMAIAGGATPEEISGTPPPPLSETMAANEKAAEKKAEHPGPHPQPASPAGAPQKK